MVKKKKKRILKLGGGDVRDVRAEMLERVYREDHTDI